MENQLNLSLGLAFQVIRMLSQCYSLGWDWPSGPMIAMVSRPMQLLRRGEFLIFSFRMRMKKGIERIMPTTSVSQMTERKSRHRVVLKKVGFAWQLGQARQKDFPWAPQQQSVLKAEHYWGFEGKDWLHGLGAKMLQSKSGAMRRRIRTEIAKQLIKEQNKAFKARDQDRRELKPEKKSLMLCIGFIMLRAITYDFSNL